MHAKVAKVFNICAQPCCIFRCHRPLAILQVERGDMWRNWLRLRHYKVHKAGKYFFLGDFAGLHRSSLNEGRCSILQLTRTTSRAFDKAIAILQTIVRGGHKCPLKLVVHGNVLRCIECSARCAFAPQSFRVYLRNFSISTVGRNSRELTLGGEMRTWFGSSLRDGEDRRRRRHVRFARWLRVPLQHCRVRRSRLRSRTR